MIKYKDDERVLFYASTRPEVYGLSDHVHSAARNIIILVGKPSERYKFNVEKSKVIEND